MESAGSLLPFQLRHGLQQLTKLRLRVKQKWWCGSKLLFQCIQPLCGFLNVALTTARFASNSVRCARALDKNPLQANPSSFPWPISTRLEDCRLLDLHTAQTRQNRFQPCRPFLGCCNPLLGFQQDVCLTSSQQLGSALVADEANSALPPDETAATPEAIELTTV